MGISYSKESYWVFGFVFERIENMGVDRRVKVEL